MIKNQYIAWILFIVLAVTIYHLFYKDVLISSGVAQKWLPAIMQESFDNLCPPQGFKCPTESECDCKSLCPQHDYQSFQVMDDEIYVLREKLQPGAYCLPKGMKWCHQATSFQVFTLSGWSCLPRNAFEQNVDVTCKSTEARDNSRNVLWDHLRDAQAEPPIDDYYEPLGDQLRYRCHCDSPSLEGLPMHSILPLTCSVDYCLRDIPENHLTDNMGWNGSECDCTVYFHAVEGDPLSPCVLERTRYENNWLVAVVDQMTEKSYIPRLYFRPSSQAVAIFSLHVVGGNNPREYLESFLRNS